MLNNNTDPRGTQIIQSSLQLYSELILVPNLHFDKSLIDKFN